MKNIFSLITLLAFTATSFSQNLDKSIEYLINNQYPPEGPGGAILVAQKGEVIYQGGFGYANIENKVVNTPENVFMIGSITKQFTAVSILMLEEEGKLSVDDLVTKHLPDYPEHKITIRHLLNHTAGLPNYTSLPDWMAEMNEQKTTTEMMAIFKDLPLEFEPGTDWAYSNSGYIVLGAIIEQISGDSYENFIEQNIFAAIGMNHSYYGKNGEKFEGMADGYSANANGGFDHAMEFSLSHPSAAGSILSTVGDQFTWIQAIRDNKLISEESKQKAWTPYTLPNGESTNYGFGWMMNEIAGYPSIEHGGGIFGFVCSGVYIPEQDIFVSILTNRDGVSPDEIAVRIAAAVAGHPYMIGETITLTEEEMDEYVAIYDFEDGSSRTITRDGGKLYSQRNGSSKIRIIPVAKDRFVFEGYEMSEITFTRNNMNRIGGAVAKFRIDEIKGKRTNKEIVERVEITLQAEELQRFEGTYELAPTFSISVDERDGRLFAQATNQPEFELFATTKTRFFLKVVDAEVEFYEGEDGEIRSLTLFQNGAEMPGKKK